MWKNPRQSSTAVFFDIFLISHKLMNVFLITGTLVTDVCFIIIVLQMLAQKEKNVKKCLRITFDVSMSHWKINKPKYRANNIKLNI